MLAQSHAGPNPSPSRVAAWAERRPILFSIAIMILIVAFSILTQALMAPFIDLIGSDMLNILASAVVSVLFGGLALGMGWWRAVGLRAPVTGSAWGLLLLPLMLVAALYNGLNVTGASGLLTIAVAAMLTGFLEEIIFRGLILRAFLPKGATHAVLVSALLFSLFHLINLIGGAPLGVTLIQLVVAVTTALFMGAVTVKSGSLWPAILYHAAHDFMIWLGQGGLAMPIEPGTTWKVIMVAGQVLLGLYGLLLLFRKGRKG